MKYQIRYIIFVAFFLSSSLVAKAETNLEKISLQLQWKEQFQFAGYFIAKEKGFYEDVGLDVEIKKFTNTTLVVKEVIENRATYGTGRSSLLVDKGNKADIKLLASIFQTTPLILLTTNKDIQTISDIKGKKIMFTEDSITTSSLLATMSSNQITNSDLIKIKHSFDINDLITHKTDLMVAYSSSEPYLLKKKGIPFKMFSPKDYGFDFYSDILFTSTSEIKQNPRRVANFKNASLKGWEYAFNHIEETVDILLKKYNEQNKTRDELLFEARELKTLAYYDNAPLGDIDKNKLERIYDLYKLMGKINNIYDISELLEEESGQIVFTKEELAYLKKHPVLKAHNKSLCQPMNYNDGIAKGFSVDYMNLIAKKIGVKVEYIGGYSWSEFLSLLQTQALDVIINIVKTEDELKTISFQEPYYTLYNAIYVNSDSSIYYSLESLENKKVGTIKESYIQKYLSKNYPKIKQVTAENQLEALHLLSLGKIDAVIGEKVIIDNLIANNNIPKVIAITYLDEKDMVADLRLGVAKSDTVLHTILQKGKAKISEEEMRELKKRWFLSDTINNDNNLILTNDEKNI